MSSWLRLVLLVKQAKFLILIIFCITKTQFNNALWVDNCKTSTSYYSVNKWWVIDVLYRFLYLYEEMNVDNMEQSIYIFVEDMSDLFWHSWTVHVSIMFLCRIIVSETKIMNLLDWNNFVLYPYIGKLSNFTD